MFDQKFKIKKDDDTILYACMLTYTIIQGLSKVQPTLTIFRKATVTVVNMMFIFSKQAMCYATRGLQRHLAANCNVSVMFIGGFKNLHRSR